MNKIKVYSISPAEIYKKGEKEMEEISSVLLGDPFKSEKQMEEEEEQEDIEIEEEEEDQEAGSKSKDQSEKGSDSEAETGKKEDKKKEISPEQFFVDAAKKAMEKGAAGFLSQVTEMFQEDFKLSFDMSDEVMDDMMKGAMSLFEKLSVPFEKMRTMIAMDMEFIQKGMLKDALVNKVLVMYDMKMSEISSKLVQFKNKWKKNTKIPEKIRTNLDKLMMAKICEEVKEKFSAIRQEWEEFEDSLKNMPEDLRSEMIENDCPLYKKILPRTERLVLKFLSEKYAGEDISMESEEMAKELTSFVKVTFLEFAE
jgi:hypothetical protein